jgi:hypothetical protein
MFDALIGGLLSGIGLLISAGLALLVLCFLFGTTIGNVILIISGVVGLLALFIWFGKRAEKKKLPIAHGWQQRCNSAPSFQTNQQPDPYLGFAPPGKPQHRISPEGLEEAEIIVPLRYQCLAQQIQPLVDLLRSAFVSRQVANGVPWPDLQSAIAGILQRLADCTAAVTSSYNRLGQTLCWEDATDDQICQSVEEIRSVVAELVDIYRSVWQRPFPPGAEKSQILCSAVIERIMRTMLEHFEQAVFVVERPKEAVARFGVAEVHLQLILEADKEIDALNQWVTAECIGLTLAKTPRYDGLGTLATAFLLGWWFGRDR